MNCAFDFFKKAFLLNVKLETFSFHLWNSMKRHMQCLHVYLFIEHCSTIYIIFGFLVLCAIKKWKRNIMKYFKWSKTISLKVIQEITAFALLCRFVFVAFQFCEFQIAANIFCHFAAIKLPQIMDSSTNQTINNNACTVTQTTVQKKITVTILSTRMMSAAKKVSTEYRKLYFAFVRGYSD